MYMSTSTWAVVAVACTYVATQYTMYVHVHSCSCSVATLQRLQRTEVYYVLSFPQDFTSLALALRP